MTEKASETTKTLVTAELVIRPIMAVDPTIHRNNIAVGQYEADFLKSVHSSLGGMATLKVVRNPMIRDHGEGIYVAANLVHEVEVGSPLSLAWQKHVYESKQGKTKSTQAAREALKAEILSELGGWHGLTEENFRLSIAVADGEAG